MYVALNELMGTTPILRRPRASKNILKRFLYRWRYVRCDVRLTLSPR